MLFVLFSRLIYGEQLTIFVNLYFNIMNYYIYYNYKNEFISKKNILKKPLVIFNNYFRIINMSNLIL